MSDKQDLDHTYGETQLIVFALENEQLAEIYFSTGNDLETSDVLYFALFCITSKERFRLRRYG